MPLVEISHCEQISPKQKVKIANDICNLLVKAIPGVPKDGISVAFYDHSPENWIIGGVTVKEIQQKKKK